MTEKKT